MATINKILNAISKRATSRPVEKLVAELKENNEQLIETRSKIDAEKMAPHQAKNSPYVEDRPFFDPFVRQHSDAEQSWKDVKSRDEQAQDIYREENLKKLNVLF